MKYLWVKRDIESRLTHILNRSYFLLFIRIYPAKPSSGATLLPPRTCVLCRRQFQVVITVSLQDLRQETLKSTTNSSYTAVSYRPSKSPGPRNIKSKYIFGNNHLYSHFTRNSILLYTILFTDRTFLKSLLNPLALEFMCSKLTPKIKKEEYFITFHLCSQYVGRQSFA